MLDILGNIDTANYFIQDALFNTVQQGLEVHHNVYQGDGYFVDIIETRKNTFNVNITTLGRQNIARILVSKDEIVLRYSAKFMLTYKKKLICSVLIYLMSHLTLKILKLLSLLKVLW